MSYVIFGRAIKNEYLTLATLGTVFGGVAVARSAMSGKKKQEPKGFVEKVKQAVPITAGSSEEEEFIRKFIEEAEKDSTH